MRSHALRYGGAATRFLRSRRDALASAALFVFSFFVFRHAPIHQTGDSRYTMLLADNLLRHGDVALERYGLPESDYRIRHVDGHDYYYFPPGSSVLSVPFVAAMRLRGVSAVRSDGTYDVEGERVLDAKLSAALMAGFASVTYSTSRLLLPLPWSLAIAGVSTFGTQVFSTASRSMWSDTWGILLVSLAVRLLLSSSIREKRVNAPLLATLEALAYFVRPTNAIVLFGSALFLTARHRRALVPFLAVLAFWASLFVAYSSIHFHAPLPDYFAAGRIHLPLRFAAWLGNLVSPSRGLFVYVPAVLAVAMGIARFWSALRCRSLVALSGFVIVVHLLALSGFDHWWGGHSYGARLTTSLVPWFVLLAVLATNAARRATRTRGMRPADVTVAAAVSVLCVASVVVNGIGAFSRASNDWNAVPEDVDKAPARLWDWRHPQFAAPFEAR